MTRLTSLNLRDNLIGDEGARALAASPHLRDEVRQVFDDWES